MKKLIASLAAATWLMAAGAAMAEEAKGTVQAMDVDTRLIMLDNGDTFRVVEGTPMADLKPGDEVTVSYEMQGGEKVALDIKLER